MYMGYKRGKVRIKREEGSKKDKWEKKGTEGQDSKWRDGEKVKTKEY